MQRVAFAVLSLAPSKATLQNVPTATLSSRCSRPLTVAAPHAATSASFGGGDGSSDFPRRRGFWWRDGDSDGNGDGDGSNWGGAGEYSFLLPLASTLLSASSFGAAFFGWGVSSLLEDGAKLSRELSADDLREAAHIGLFGLIVHGLLGTLVYRVLDDTVSGSTPIPVAIKALIDGIILLPFLANAHDAYCDYIRAGKAGKFMQSIRTHEHSPVELLRRKMFWVPAQAISFLLLPAWWRVGYTSFIMASLAFLRVVGRGKLETS